ncbi:TadE/TadG family type IV pilus assembly protein [Phenylobacterium sp.]|jgi:hypothetical protein|uniref:TadE/TadG family type IV pilus assembly protein n=1 Tax=Phenylobacterium sp. TaxID=1871053 RepID=UPI002F3E8395
MGAFPIRRFGGHRSGASAVEFALVMPAFIAMLAGAIWAGQLAFASNSMHYAVEAGARCAAVNAVTCPDATTTLAYTRSHYSGPQISPVFTYGATGCGHTVSASATFNLNIVPGIKSVPLTAAACYP